MAETREWVGDRNPAVLDHPLAGSHMPPDIRVEHGLAQSNERHCIQNHAKCRATNSRLFLTQARKEPAAAIVLVR